MQVLPGHNLAECNLTAVLPQSAFDPTCTCLGRENAPARMQQLSGQQQRVFMTAFNNTQLEISGVYLLLPGMCVVKETALEQKTFREVVAPPHH